MNINMNSVKKNSSVFKHVSKRINFVKATKVYKIYKNITIIILAILFGLKRLSIKKNAKT